MAGSFRDKFSQAFQKTMKEKGLKAALSELGGDVLPKLKLANNFVARAALSGKVKGFYDGFAQSLRGGKYDADIQKLSDDLRKLTREEIREAVQSRLNAAENPAAAAKVAAKHEQTVKGMTADEYVRMVSALHAVMPDVAANLHNMLFSTKSFEQSARDYFNLTPEARTQHHIDLAKKVPVDAVTDAVFEMCQKATPQALRAAALDLASGLSASDAKNFLYDAMDFMQDLLTVAKKSNAIGVRDAKAAAAFGGNVRNVFNKAATSLAKAGITPDTDLEAAFKKAFGQPFANDNTPPAAADAPQRKKGGEGPKNA